MIKNLLIAFLPLLLFSCGGNDDEVQPEREPERPTEQPAEETTSSDPVEVDGAPMKVMTLSHEDFMRLFVGKKWVRCPQLTISKDGKFSICDLTGFYSADMVVESEETVIAEGINAADEPYTSRRSFKYDEQTGCLLFPNGLPAFVGYNKSVRVALLNEECLMAFENKEGRGGFGDYIVYMFRNGDESTLHQPAPRQAESVFPFKMSLDKATFVQDILTDYVWSPFITLGVYDDGTVALTTLEFLKDTYLVFGSDGTMREYFIDSKSKKRSWHNCPYTYDAETGTVAFREGCSPTPFRAYADRVQAFSSWGFNGVQGMMGLAVNTQGKSRFKQIVCIFYGCGLNYVKDWEQTATEVPFEE